ncbi:MAG: hypothetical protein AVDCRST_MAG07-1483, partial [uncultured Frankineae bacterium]
GHPHARSTGAQRTGAGPGRRSPPQPPTGQPARRPARRRARRGGAREPAAARLRGRRHRGAHDRRAGCARPPEL